MYSHYCGYAYSSYISALQVRDSANAIDDQRMLARAPYRLACMFLHIFSSSTQQSWMYRCASSNQTKKHIDAPAFGILALKKWTISTSRKKTPIQMGGAPLVKRVADQAWSKPSTTSNPCFVVHSFFCLWFQCATGRALGLMPRIVDFFPSVSRLGHVSWLAWGRVPQIMVRTPPGTPYFSRLPTI